MVREHSPLGENISGRGDLHSRRKCFLCKQCISSSLNSGKDFKEFIALGHGSWEATMRGFLIHFACHALLSETFAPPKRPSVEKLKRLSDATKYLYTPRDPELETLAVRQALLSPHTRDVVHDTCNQALFGKLPPEIQLMIARFTGSVWYLTILAEVRPLLDELTPAPLYPEQLSLTKSVFLSRIEYQGRSYLSAIHSKASENQGKNEQQCIDLPNPIDKIVVSVDHVGVRGVQFLGRNASPAPDGSPWYETIDVSDKQSRLFIHHNGIFVRAMKVRGDRPSYGSCVWTAPDPPNLIMRNMRDFSKFCRLEYLKFTPDVRGLLVCCDNSGIQGIHACTELYQPPRCVVDFTERGLGSKLIFWTYFPINSGETIENAWNYQHQGGQCMSSSLTFRTSLGRTVLFGPEQPAILADTHQYRSLRRKGDGYISGIVHDGLDPDLGPFPIWTFGVVCDSNRAAKDPEPEPPFRRYTMPRFGRPGMPGFWFITEAKLDGVRRVRVSRDSKKSHNPCIGMLLYYEDGHIESVGRVHWNLEMERDIHTPVAISTAFGAGTKYVKSIVPCSPRSRAPELLILPERGTIVWWFSYRGDEVVIYDD